MKRKMDAFRCHKQKTKVRFLYLEVKLHQERCAWSIYNLKTAQMEELSNSNAKEQLASYWYSF